VETIPGDDRSEDAGQWRRRHRSALVRGIGLGAAALVLAVAVGPGLHVVGAGSPATSPGAPTGGLTRDQAIALVRKSYDGGSVKLGALIFADAGPFGQVTKDRILAGFGAEVGPDRLVWFVRFWAESGPICPPNGNACQSSRSGVTTLVIDYYTGDTLWGMGGY
jgi:hypothetical protein